MSKSKYQDIFVKLSERSKKKGGGLSAVFKLIQELADFEEKIEECARGQEITQNRETIDGFISDLDRMYDALFEMARGGISDIRDNRGKLNNEEYSNGELGEDPQEEVIRERTTDEPTRSLPEIPEVPRKSFEDAIGEPSINIPKMPRM